MHKFIKYILIALAVPVVIFFSLKIENLEEYKAANFKETFDATIYAQKIWDEKIPHASENAVEISDLISLLRTVPDDAFNKFGHVLGISKTHYFMLKGKGTIESVEEEFLRVKTSNNESIQIATDFIFGNAVRDGSGLVSINEFLNMTDFNNVSVSINKLVKEKVVSKLKIAAMPGMTIEFVGATEINEENIDLQNIRIIPVSAKLSNEKVD
jgi:predicted lipoprotein